MTCFYSSEKRSEASYDVGLRRRLLPLFRSLNSWKVMNKQVYTCCLKRNSEQTIVAIGTELLNGVPVAPSPCNSSISIEIALLAVKG